MFPKASLFHINQLLNQHHDNVDAVISELLQHGDGQQHQQTRQQNTAKEPEILDHLYDDDDEDDDDDGDDEEDASDDDDDDDDESDGGDDDEEEHSTDATPSQAAASSPTTATTETPSESSASQPSTLTPQPPQLEFITVDDGEGSGITFDWFNDSAANQAKYQKEKEMQEKQDHLLALSLFNMVRL